MLHWSPLYQLSLEPIRSSDHVGRKVPTDLAKMHMGSYYIPQCVVIKVWNNKNLQTCFMIDCKQSFSR